MALSPSYATTFATAATDEDILKKRQDLASRLMAAKGQGKSMENAVLSETGVNVGNIQKGSIDTKMGTGLSEEEIAGFAERLFQPKQPTPITAPPSSNNTKPESGFRNLDRLAAMQNEPMGSASIGASGVQGAVGGLARGQSRTNGTPIGRGSSRDRNVQIAANILGRAYRERQRTAAEMDAEEEAYNRVYGGGELKQMPYFNK